MKRISGVHKTLQLSCGIVSLHLELFGLLLSLVLDGLKVGIHLSLEGGELQTGTINIIIGSILSGLGKIGGDWWGIGSWGLSGGWSLGSSWSFGGWSLGGGWCLCCWSFFSWGSLGSWCFSGSGLIFILSLHGGSLAIIIIKKTL